MNPRIAKLLIYALMLLAGAPLSVCGQQETAVERRGLDLLGLGVPGAMQAPQTPGPASRLPAGFAQAEPSAAVDGTAGVRPDAPVSTVQQADYRANLESDVFGANLFTGAFAHQGATQFNPDYAVAIGDRIRVRLWGAFDFDQVLTVDPKGNIFVPHAGPVSVLGVKNKELERIVSGAVAKAFLSNVFSYAALEAAQPVRVFVSGYVNRPGLYSGTSMDSLLHYLDQAGGIDPERGSFLNVTVKRGADIRATVDLYDFLLEGRIPSIQLADGDVIFVDARTHTLAVRGLAENANRFEYVSPNITLSALNNLAKPLPSATHVRVVRNTGTTKNIEYYALIDSGEVLLGDGDEVEFTADKRPGTITVRVEGEHESPQEYVLPYGTRLGELISRITYSERSDAASIQLFRKSVQERQKETLMISLRSLETAALTARSGTSDEAKLRKEEADLILNWVDRAKDIEPSGQVVIAQATTRDDILLENGDVVHVPVRDGLVLINGEVLFPNAVAHDIDWSLEDYIAGAGGYTQNAETARIVIAHRDGSFENVSGQRRLFSRAPPQAEIAPGDEILVLPRIDVKSRQIIKDWSQIIFQLAVTAGVVLGI